MCGKGEAKQQAKQIQETHGLLSSQEKQFLVNMSVKCYYYTSPLVQEKTAKATSKKKVTHTFALPLLNSASCYYLLI